MRWAVLGSSGFVGSAVSDVVAARGDVVVAVAAPRLQTAARTLDDLLVDAAARSDVVDELAAAVAGCDIVVNAAGAADPDSPGSDALFGANALLPPLVAMAAGRAGVRRFVHVSSQSVLGDVPTLTEDPIWRPFSPYSGSKALGEQALVRDREPACPSVVFRALSVQGATRGTTARLVALARGRMAAVAVDGPTPLTLIENTADAVVFCGASDDDPPAIVLQQGDGLTTREALELLGARRVRRIPRVIARAGVGGLRAVGRLDKRFAGLARRAELLLFGQAYDARWMVSQGYVPVAGRDAWMILGQTVAAAGEGASSAGTVG